MKPRPLCKYGVVHIEYEESLTRSNGLSTGGLCAGPMNFFFTRYGQPTSLTQPERQAIYDKFMLNTRAFVGVQDNKETEAAILGILQRVLREASEHFGFEVAEEEAEYVDDPD